MITEDYVSFETAKLLKEKGFDEDCHAHWDLTTETKTPKIGLSVSSKNWNYKWNPIQFPISAPTHQMAMKWLREVHNIFIVIEPHMYDYINEKNSSYVASLWQGDNYYENIISKDCPTYEETVEAAIKYCLENLI